MTKQKTSNDSPQLPSLSTTSPSSPRWGYISAATLGLLSSSCCLIQLALNLLSVGCAGFSVLTPYRPLFLVFSSLLVLVTIYKYRWSSRTALTLALVLTLTTTPEMVAVYNQSSTGSLRRLPDTFLLATPSSVLRLPTFLENVQWNIPAFLTAPSGVMTRDEPIAAALVPDQLSSQDQAVGSSSLGSHDTGGMFMKYVVQIDGMACEACASRLRQHFSRQDGIERANVFFDEKKLVLWTQAGSGSMMLSERVIQDMVGLVDAKYTARLEDIFSFSSITS
ncbi:hypothetical protein EC957_007852 [Mortierella hygrophila]|uniref:HMA domain-containing protein n=1 Tax=Mortierella hygrophila TaxID=979708 RepID=A0A9P6JY60_9FUNG|nr:hypothetical protein EC957_007852 [Mortierella hygrophila]